MIDSKFNKNVSVEMDNDFFVDKKNEKVMERAQEAKYIQDKLSQQVLLATKNAKLF